MAERTSTPVKPPTLEGKARSSNAGGSSARTHSGARPSRPHSPWPSFLLAGLGGGLLGALFVVLLAGLGALPMPRSDSATQDALLELERLRGRIAALESSQSEFQSADEARQSELANRLDLLESVNSNIADAALEELQLRTATTDDNLELLRSELSQLAAQMDAASEAPAAASSTEFAALAAEVETLQQMFDGLVADAEAEPAAATTETFVEDLTGLRAALALLSGRVEHLVAQNDNLTAQNTSSQTTLSDLSQRVASLEAAQGRNDRLAEDVRLPLAVIALEDEVNASAPFADELTALMDLAPSIATPTQLHEFALTGLASTAELAARFTSNMPELLAALPQDRDIALTDQLMNSLTTLFAVRRTNESPNTENPATHVAAVESLLHEGSMRAAATAMQILAPEVAQRLTELDPELVLAVEAHASLVDYLAALRRLAISGGNTLSDEVSE